MQHYSDNQGDEISLKELVGKIRNIFDYLISKWYVVVCFGLLGGILGFTYAHFQKPTYTATTTFVLEGGEGGGAGLGQYAGLASMVGLDIGNDGGGIFQGDNLLQLYKTRNMLRKAILSEVEFNGVKQLLIDRYIEINRLKENWEKKPGLKGISFNQSNHGERFSRVQDSILGVIIADINKNYISVDKPDKKLSITKVTVKSNDEQFAKVLNEQIVKTVNEFYVQTKTRKALDNLAILQHQTDSVKKELTGAIYSGAAVMDATPNLNPTRQVLRAPASRSQFNAEANKAILSQLIQNLELSKMSLRKETPLIQIIDSPIYPLDKEILGKAKGILIGGIIFGFISVLYLVIKKILKTLF